jgi:hypothetical protein
VSETASNPRADLSVPDPTQAQVPAQLWLRSGRPMFGTAVRVYVAFAIIAGGLIFVPRGPVLWGMIGGGVLAFVLFPLVIQGLLAPLERRVLAAGRREATPLLQEVRARGLVRRFAPHAWLTLQEGRLHLRRGDGRAAARAFTETLRLSRSADTPALISAQAQALVIAEQPEQARELLQALGRRQALSAGDQLTLGLALLGGKGNGREALAHIQAAQAGLGDLPRVLAALALALHRADQAEAGLVALQQAQDSLGPDPDPFDEGLVQRGVKLLRTVQKAQERRERKSQNKQQRVEGVARVAVPAPVKPGAAEERPASPGKSARKAKKEERRASRRAAKAEKRSVGAEAPVKASVTASKAAKIAPKGKAAKAIEPHKLKAVTPGVQDVVKPGGLSQETGAKAAVKPVVQDAVKAAVLSQETGAKVAVQEPVKPVVQDAVKAAVLSQETGAKPVAPSSPPRPPLPGAPGGAVVRPEAPRSPAPPPGAALFGSVAAKPSSAPAPAFGAPPAGLRLPPRPGPAAPGATPSAAPSAARSSAPVSSPAVPKVMSPAAPAPAVGLAPVVPVEPIAARVPAVPATPAGGVLPPVTPAAAPSPAMPVAPSFVPPAAAAPSLVMPVPAAPTLVMPTTPAAPLLTPPPMAPSLGLPVAPSLPKPPQVVAPVLVSQPGPTARIGEAPPPGLAQVLPDTDDGWDDMLDALEADNTRH